MAELKLPIKIDGLGFVIGLMKKLVDEIDFKEDVSEDYKKGFYDFSNAVIDTLEKLKDDDFIRCLDCKYLKVDTLDQKPAYFCTENIFASRRVKLDDYCSYGARMDGDL